MRTILSLMFVLFLGSVKCTAQKISNDDKYHFAAGAIISATTYTLVYSKTKNKKKAFWMSLGASTLAGLLKEVYDGTKSDNRFDTGEFLATTAGGLTATVVFDIFTGKNKN